MYTVSTITWFVFVGITRPDIVLTVCSHGLLTNIIYMVTIMLISYYSGGDELPEVDTKKVNSS